MFELQNIYIEQTMSVYSNGVFIIRLVFMILSILDFSITPRPVTVRPPLYFLTI